jgi:hypothetical protein
VRDIDVYPSTRQAGSQTRAGTRVHMDGERCRMCVQQRACAVGGVHAVRATVTDCRGLAEYMWRLWRCREVNMRERCMQVCVLQGWMGQGLRVDGWLTRRRVERAARVVATRVLCRGRSSDHQHSERGKHGTVQVFDRVWRLGVCLSCSLFVAMQCENVGTGNIEPLIKLFCG